MTKEQNTGRPVFIKILFIFLGMCALFLGILGIIIPGLPTTPFLLLSAGLFFRSSKRLYRWLMRQSYFGVRIRYYRIHRALPLKTKIYANSLMWIMIFLSVFLFIDQLWIRIIIIAAGITGSIVMIRVIPTYEAKFKAKAEAKAKAKAKEEVEDR
jgi:hypothetical protein